MHWHNTLQSEQVQARALRNKNPLGWALGIIFVVCYISFISFL